MFRSSHHLVSVQLMASGFWWMTRGDVVVAFSPKPEPVAEPEPVAAPKRAPVVDVTDLAVHLPSRCLDPFVYRAARRLDVGAPNGTHRRRVCVCRRRQVSSVFAYALAT